MTAKFKTRREKKQKEAKQRQAERAKRTPAQQLAVLNNKLGVNQGATKERARLEALLQTETEQKEDQ